MSYYQLWLPALETMLKERDLVADDEIGAGHALHRRSRTSACCRPTTS